MKNNIKLLLLYLVNLTTISVNAQKTNFLTLNHSLQQVSAIALGTETKNFNPLLNLNKFTLFSTPTCENYADQFTLDDVPSFSRGVWTEHSNLLFGKHYKQYFEFNDGVNGYLFQGGISGNYFISNDTGDTVYFSSLRTAIRGLYIYKRFGCFSKYGRK